MMQLRCDRALSGHEDPWIVVNTRPHAEQTALENLQRQTYEAYCPMLRKRRSHARRVEMVLRPLFPGYLFARCGKQARQWRPVLSTYGVRTVVRAGEEPSLIDHGFIASLKAREIDGAIVRPAKPYEVGQKVQIAGGGAFDGIVATIIDLEEEERVVVLLDVLQRATRLTLDVGAVTPVS
jgi:transcriptional antiterminator RfaH